MTQPLFGHLTAGMPTIAEQREIAAYNAPIIEALSVSVLTAKRLFGMDSPEYVAACKLFDAADAIKNSMRRIGD